MAASTIRPEHMAASAGGFNRWLGGVQWINLFNFLLDASGSFPKIHGTLRIEPELWSR